MKNDIKKLAALYVCHSYDSLMVISVILKLLDLEVIITTYETIILDEINKLPEIKIVVLDDVQNAEDLEWCDRLKNDARTKNAPIIVVLNKENISHSQLDKFNIDLYMKTPVDINSFEEIVRRYVHK
jgi:CheY-like chemotaxis protein